MFAGAVCIPPAPKENAIIRSSRSSAIRLARLAAPCSLCSTIPSLAAAAWSSPPDARVAVRAGSSSTFTSQASTSCCPGVDTRFRLGDGEIWQQRVEYLPFDVLTDPAQRQGDLVATPRPVSRERDAK